MNKILLDDVSDAVGACDGVEVRVTLVAVGASVGTGEAVNARVGVGGGVTVEAGAGAGVAQAVNRIAQMINRFIANALSSSCQLQSRLDLHFSLMTQQRESAQRWICFGSICASPQDESR